jgi:hypothetical protein
MVLTRSGGFYIQSLARERDSLQQSSIIGFGAVVVPAWRRNDFFFRKHPVDRVQDRHVLVRHGASGFLIRMSQPGLAVIDTTDRGISDGRRHVPLDWGGAGFQRFAAQ